MHRLFFRLLLPFLLGLCFCWSLPSVAQAAAAKRAPSAAQWKRLKQRAQLDATKYARCRDGLRKLAAQPVRERLTPAQRKQLEQFRHWLRSAADRCQSEHGQLQQVLKKYDAGPSARGKEELDNAHSSLVALQLQMTAERNVRWASMMCAVLSKMSRAAKTIIQNMH